MSSNDSLPEIATAAATVAYNSDRLLHKRRRSHHDVIAPSQSLFAKKLALLLIAASAVCLQFGLLILPWASGETDRQWQGIMREKGVTVSSYCTVFLADASRPSVDRNTIERGCWPILNDSQRLASHFQQVLWICVSASFFLFLLTVLTIPASFAYDHVLSNPDHSRAAMFYLVFNVVSAFVRPVVSLTTAAFWVFALRSLVRDFALSGAWWVLVILSSVDLVNLGCNYSLFRACLEEKDAGTAAAPVKESV